MFPSEPDPRGRPVSPVDQSRNHVGQAATVAIVAVVILGLGLFLAAKAISPKTGVGDGQVSLGDQTFQGGSAEDLADEIADRGPILYSDVSGRRDRDMILQHLGDDPDTGWSAFLAAPLDKDRSCTWEWEADEDQFRARCDRSLTAPADGEGLPQFTVTVKGGRLDVDLNADAKATTTTRP